ncbi:hypothetical protein VP1G_04495 [Cytospora mali]|uniref:Uncharacterized protein n=1 Tax=Cytospora mali TaxID=578113 RepID=A0A194V046_CYTMA|nr:hypothetical protein VP1G_04495 [Valsa mali var. pyri (nom. inval.)]
MDSELRNKDIVPDASATTRPDKGKGKGKEAAASERQPDAGDSIMSRIGKSAAELSRSVLQGTPTTSDLANVATSGKQPGASSSSRTIEQGESSSSAPAPSTFGSNAFRSGQADAHSAAEESAFSEFLNNTPAFVPAEPVGLEATHYSPGPSVYRDSAVTDISSVAVQQERDGIEVVRLLSQADEEMPEYEGNIVVSETELKNLRQALFEDGPNAQLSPTDWNNALNFVPDFLRGDGADGEGMEASENSYLNLGVTEPAEAGSLWLEQWNRVLTSYTDEVWGDLGDLVKRAQTEVERLKDSDKTRPTDAPAVQQLRSILTRVRARL